MLEVFDQSGKSFQTRTRTHRAFGAQNLIFDVEVFDVFDRVKQNTGSLDVAFLHGKKEGSLPVLSTRGRLRDGNRLMSPLGLVEAGL